MLGERRDDAGLHVRGRAQVEGHVPPAQLVKQCGVVLRHHPVRDAAHAELEHLAHSLGAGDLTGMCSERKPALARGDEGDRVRWRRPRSLRARQVEPDHRPADVGGAPGQVGIGCGRVLPHGCHDQADERRRHAELAPRALDTVGDRLDHRRHPQPALEVQARRPADLGVRDAVRGEIRHQLGGDALEGDIGLEQLDRQVEVPEQIRLVGAPLRTDHALPGLVERERDAGRLRELHRRLRAHGSVEVLVQLCLGEDPQVVGLHPAMIGIRTAGAAIVAVTVTALLLGAGSPRPEIDVGARALVERRAAVAAAAVDALDRELAPALDAARTGSARVVAGEAAPGPALVDAAAIVRRAEPHAQRAREAAMALERAIRARSPAADPDLAPVPKGELTSIAAQLDGTVEAADAFAAMRHRADGALAALEDALTALDEGDIARARDLVAAARADRDALAAWEVELATLPVWLDVADEMIRSMERIIDATDRGDASEARVAAETFAALGDEAATADRALRIAMSEGGASVAAPALGRLAEAMAAIDETRQRIATAAESAR